jgi:hypothetical protein
MNAPPAPEPLGPPPFAFHEDAAFLADMSLVAPDDKIRDEICADLQYQINRIFAGLDVPGHSMIEEGIESELLITQKTGIAPALRVVFSVVDEYPRRHVNFHAASLRDQNGAG